MSVVKKSWQTPWKKEKKRCKLGDRELCHGLLPSRLPLGGRNYYSLPSCLWRRAKGKYMSNNIQKKMLPYRLIYQNKVMI